MGFCPDEKCEHYSKATKYPRKCYYEPQCWKGYLDLFIALIGLRFRRSSWQLRTECNYKTLLKEVMPIEEDKPKNSSLNKGGLES